jgi:hypothetical protein
VSAAAGAESSGVAGASQEAEESMNDVNTFLNSATTVSIDLF